MTTDTSEKGLEQFHLPDDSEVFDARDEFSAQEYCTRLIADVVTGKMDVREAAAQLPEEADDQDPIEDGFLLTDDTGDNCYDADEEAA